MADLIFDVVRQGNNTVGGSTPPRSPPVSVKVFFLGQILFPRRNPPISSEGYKAGNCHYSSGVGEEVSQFSSRHSLTPFTSVCSKTPHPYTQLSLCLQDQSFFCSPSPGSKSYCLQVRLGQCVTQMIGWEVTKGFTYF